MMKLLFFLEGLEVWFLQLLTVSPRPDVSFMFCLMCCTPPTRISHKTGTSVDAHLAECVAAQLPLRAGHSDMFHCFDGVGQDVLRRRGAANAAGSNSSSSSDGRAAGSVPTPLSVLDSWTQIVRAQRKLLRRGQGAFSSTRAISAMGSEPIPARTAQAQPAT